MKDKHNPLVSIISPIYGVEDYIEESLESMFNQTYKEIEFVFVNDKTPDHSMDILYKVISKYEHINVKIVEHEKNMGLCGVRNTGLKAASGDYFMIVDSDDLLPKDAVETLVSCALRENADYVESDFAYYPGYIGTTIKRYNSDDKIEYLSSFLSMKTSPSIWGKLYRRTLFPDIDDLFVIGRDNAEDAFATPILIDRANKIAYTDKVTYYYRIDNPNAYSMSKYVKWNKVDDLIYCVQRHEDYFKDYNNPKLMSAINEKKYWIVTYYYPKLSDKKERKKLVSLYPEINNLVKSKPLKQRIKWFIMKHDMCAVFMIISGLKRNV